MRRRSLLLTSSLFVSFILGGLLLPRISIGWRSANAGADTTNTAVNLAQIDPEEIYAKAAAIGAPSVVNIDTQRKVRVRTSWFDDDFYEPQYQRVTGSGSGVIISSDGDIITNAHVVEGADAINVTLPTGKSYSGRVVGSDHSTDVALIKIDAGKLPVAKLGRSKGLIPGQLAVAIGNPLGLRFTVTHGIVSALGRPVKVGDRAYENLIQTDCAINPGNSGGALVDRLGELIGINTLVAEQANGVGFAIPIDTALRISSELKKYGKIKRPWTGLYVTPITSDIRDYLGLDSNEGALVASVVSGSPAEDAGLQRGDVIAELNGEKIKNDDDVRHITERLKIGDKVTVVVQRNGQEGKGVIKIAEAP